MQNLIFTFFFLIVAVYAQKPNTAQVQAKIKIRPASTPAPKFNTLQAKSSMLGMPLQVENPWKALDTMRGHQSLQADELQMIMTSAVAGIDYPAYRSIPENPNFNCQAMNQPGFYADPTAQCQVFRRCDSDGNMFSFLCPETTIFNQITLTCDYFFNVDCSKATRYYDYSNSRLYHEGWLLLDN